MSDNWAKEESLKLAAYIVDWKLRKVDGPYPSDAIKQALLAAERRGLERAAQRAFDCFGPCGECSSNIGHAIRALGQEEQ